jgi:hypothetical protein
VQAGIAMRSSEGVLGIASAGRIAGQCSGAAACWCVRLPSDTSQPSGSSTTAPFHHATGSRSHLPGPHLDSRAKSAEGQEAQPMTADQIAAAPTASKLRLGQPEVGMRL